MAMIDPNEWTLPDPEAVIAQMDPGSRAIKRETWVFTEQVSSLDLYCYLKHRFGEPNGFAMILRSPSVDNFVHWNYTIASGPIILDLLGLDLRTELTALQPLGTGVPEWPLLEKRLVEEFRHERQGMKAVRQRLEKWSLFVNPHSVLRVKLERQVKRLLELDLQNVATPKDPQTPRELPQFQAELARCQAVYQEAMGLCTDIHLTAPIFGESALNLITLLLAKPEVRGDKRLLDDLSRRNIDVRLKGLHLVCDGFASRIDGTEEPFKEFLRLMSRRNDRLHGNVDPTQGTGQEIYFDHRFIPLFTSSQGLTRLTLENALANADPGAALRDWEAARGFVAFLLTKLEARVRNEIELALSQQQLGYRRETKSIGVILPQVRVGLIPGQGPAPSDDTTA